MSKALDAAADVAEELRHIAPRGLWRSLKQLPLHGLHKWQKDLL